MRRNWFIFNCAATGGLILSQTIAVQALTNVNNASKITMNEKDKILTSMFNNYYGNLSSDNWITNQSTTNQKFYSYDTSHADYQLSNGTSARTVFMVDIQGNLVYNPKVKIPDVDKATIDNTKAEMIQNKKITQMKSYNNQYRLSQYSQSFFDGENKKWQFLQFGGVEKPVSLTGCAGAEKVSHFQNLNEALGLYYIAKAVQKSGGIDLEIAHQLGRNFIKKSTLKNEIDDNLTEKIVDLITKSDTISNFIYFTPFQNSDKNISLNYIFDNKNNLVEIYYQKWNKILNSNLNYDWSTTVTSNTNILSGKAEMLLNNWNYYSRSWDLFVENYATFGLVNSLFVIDSSGNAGHQTRDQFQDATNKIQTIEPYHYRESEFFTIGYSTLFGNDGADVIVWHDNNNIYYELNAWVAVYGEDNLSVKMHLGQANFLLN